MVIFYLVLAAAVAAGLAWLSTCVLIVQQKTACVIEVFGRFYKVKEAGLRLKFPFPLALVAGRVDLRINELRANVDVKTADNVFVKLPVAVQYCVKDNNVARAFYELAEPRAQIESYILNRVRSQASDMEMDELYRDKDAVERAIVTELQVKLEGYGYTIVQVLVDEPTPTEEIVQAFNRVIAARREQEAALMEGEAVKIREIKEAEAAAESKRLQGEGIARQRMEIARGLKEAMDEMRSALPAISDEALLAMTLITNQFETVRDAAGEPSNTILLPYAADGAINDMQRLAAGIEALGRDVRLGATGTQPRTGNSQTGPTSIEA